MIWWCFGDDNMVIIWWWFGDDLVMIWSWFGSDLAMTWWWFGDDLVMIWWWFSDWWWYGDDTVVIQWWSGDNMVMIWWWFGDDLLDVLQNTLKTYCQMSSFYGCMAHDVGLKLKADSTWCACYTTIQAWSLMGSLSRQGQKSKKVGTCESKVEF